MKPVISRLAILAICLCLFLSVPATPANAEVGIAQDLRKSTSVSGSGYSDFAFLTDNNISKYQTSTGNATIRLENGAGMGALYLLFNLEYGSYTITDNTTGQTVTAGEYGFLHEYVDLEAKFGCLPTSLTLSFENGAVKLSEIYIFSQGEAPDHVQIWQPALDGGADILLMATHGDDDQLFFAGLLPLYAGEMDVRVQVVYLTNHRNLTNVRVHEMLNGLWAVGVEAYPVFGDFADFRIDSLSGTYAEYKRLGTTKDDLLDFVVGNIRRFRPQVIVGHDINGEYGHGMHMVYADLLIQALTLTNDPAAYPNSANTYGLWDVPKTYLHLYKENEIVLDYDHSLDYFDGLTAFQATQKLGYPCHKSQQEFWFTKWLNGSYGQITKATQITNYNPCYFGLYRSTVGPDVLKNDFLENITTYAQQEHQAQLDREAADAVSAQIDGLGTITLDSGDAIAAVRSAYEQLTDGQKALVANGDALTAAEETYAALVQAKSDKDAADLAAAEAVMALIHSVPATLEDSDLLSRARAAYDALTQEQKALVTNYHRLTELEGKLLQLQEQQRLEQERLEQERLEQERLQREQQYRELKNLCILLGILFLFLVISLTILRRKKKAYRKK